jgi:DNA-binding transcriptional regulator YhcF (GntR family)
MRHWELAVSLDPQRAQPLFLQLADAIADDIRRGRLRPDDPLPGSRELAGLLGLNRNTIVAAYEELAAQGSVRTRIGGGTFIAATRPLPRSGSAASTCGARCAGLSASGSVVTSEKLPRARVGLTAPVRKYAEMKGNTRLTICWT